MGRRLIVEADGGSRGNPGLAGCGAVVHDADTGEVLAERAEQLGVATNNVAEYQGLIEGLRAARGCDPAVVTVRMDSKLVVEQMAGRWRVKHENLQPLAAQARQLAAELPAPEFVWVPREQNKHADRLANAAMDGEDITERERAAPEVAAAPATTAPASEAAPRPAPEQRAGDWLGAVGAPTRLLLLRHGQTSMSVDKRYSGRGDVELTELGLSQAGAAGERLAKMTGVATSDAGAAPIVTSPLVRTRQTADEVAAATGGTCEVHDGLVETDFGEWEGLTFAETSERYSELHGRWLGDPTVAPPGGETLERVAERVSAACDDLLQRYAGRTVVVVSHVTPIKAVLRRALDVGPAVFYRLHLDLASLSVAEYYPDGNASVRLVNDISHWS